MKKIDIRNKKGVTLAILLLTVLVIAILIGVTVTHLDTGKDIKEYNYMCADVELLKNKIFVYYNKYGNLPIKGTAINAKSIIGTQASENDNDNYYEIDLNLLTNITLNYGGGTLESAGGDNDVYVVNERSLEVYYLKGVSYRNSLLSEERVFYKPGEKL